MFTIFQHMHAQVKKERKVYITTYETNHKLVCMITINGDYV